jgi:hypothetical protein
VICPLGAMLLFSSCTISSPNRAPNSNPVPGKEQFPPMDDPGNKKAAKADQIIFITMSITQDPKAGTRVIQVQDLVKSPGTLKNKAEEPLLTGPYLSCIFYSGQLRLDSLHLEHPLYRHLEYVNDQHQLTHKEVKSDQADFFIRFQQGQANGLKIEERLPESIPKELITIKF